MSTPGALLDAIVAVAEAAIPALAANALRISTQPQDVTSLPPEAFPHFEILLADVYRAELAPHGQEVRTYPLGALLVHKRSGDAAEDDRETVAAEVDALAAGVAADRTLGGACETALLESARVRSDPAGGFVFAELVFVAELTV